MKKNNKTFQVLIPFDGDRGGMESLYQLVFFLKTNNQNVEIIYTTNWRNLFFKKSNLIPPSMKKYCSGVSIGEKLLDKKNNIIFIPEIFTSYVKNIKCAQINLYWLSVNNFEVGYKEFRKNFKWLLRSKYGLGRFIDPHFDMPLSIEEIGTSKINHIAQSKYAEKYIESKFGKKPIPIYDFTDEAPKYADSFFNLNIREKTILYNPVKGFEITKKLILNYSNKFNFVPIKNMTHKEVRETLVKSAIYIDFGEHPGRDRIPREAILCGCCLITGRRGSASFDDVPIDSQFKLFVGDDLVEKFGVVLDELLNQGDCHFLFQDAYDTLLKDKQLVMSQVEDYLTKLQGKN